MNRVLNCTRNIIDNLKELGENHPMILVLSVIGAMSLISMIISYVQVVTGVTLINVPIYMV